jgi:hypothetical protein
MKRRKGYRTVSGIMGDGNHPSKGHYLPLVHDSALGRIPSKLPNIPYSDWFAQNPGPIFLIHISIPLFSMLILFFCPEDGDGSFLQKLAMLYETI